MTTELSGVQKHVDAARVLEVEQALLRIPSSAFQEQQIADHLAERMKDIGLEVTMMDVVHPFDPTITSRQPMGILRGSGEGPSLMLNGHMDPGVEMPGWSVDPYAAKFEDGWVWGMPGDRAQTRWGWHPGAAAQRREGGSVYQHGALR